LRLDAWGKYEKWCLNRKSWVSLGSSKGSEYAFREHFLSKPCLSRAARYQRTAQQQQTGGAQHRGDSTTRHIKNDASTLQEIRANSVPPSSPVWPRNTPDTRQEIEVLLDNEHDDDNIGGQSAGTHAPQSDLLPFICEYKCACMPLNDS
jgi:hypothetical protein